MLFFNFFLSRLMWRDMMSESIKESHLKKQQLRNVLKRKVRDAARFIKISVGWHFFIFSFFSFFVVKFPSKTEVISVSFDDDLYRLAKFMVSLLTADAIGEREREREKEQFSWLLHVLQFNLHYRKSRDAIRLVDDESVFDSFLLLSLTHMHYNLKLVLFRCQKMK